MQESTSVRGARALKKITIVLLTTWASAPGCSSGPPMATPDVRPTTPDLAAEVMAVEHERPRTCDEAPAPSPWTILESGTTKDLFAVAATSSTNVVVAGANTFLQYDGNKWRPVADYGTRYIVRDMSATGAEIIAVGDSGLVLRQVGTNWQEHRIDGVSLLSSVWASGSQNVWVISYNGNMFRYDGTRWEFVSSPLSRAADIHGRGPNDIFVASPFDATKTDIYHFDGTAWGPPTQMPRGLGHVWMSSTGEAVFVGAQDGTVTHYSGNAWTTKDAGTDNQLYAVWGFSAADVFAAGREGTIVHYDGVNWQQVPSPTRFGLWGITSSPDGGLFIVGECGKILYRRTP